LRAVLSLGVTMFDDVLSLLCGSLAAVMVPPRSGPRSRLLNGLRVLFPSWRFFDTVDATPILLGRAGAARGELGPYRELLPPLPRKLGSLLIDAQGNLRLAYYSLLEQLMSDLDALADGDAAAARELVSYELVRELARAALIADVESPFERYQFKVRLPNGAAASAGEDVLTSEVHVV
jgi:hypothetical protein